MEHIDITREEVEQIGEALKKEEFRKLLVDYVEEISDPKNKKIYEKEITQLEKERGFDVTFINPEPGYVIKTSVNGEKKAFINVCKNDKLEKPTSVLSEQLGSKGRNWSIPYSQANPKEDLDKNGERCVVYDVVFHPETHKMAADNVRFKNLLNETALDAVENSFNVKLDRKNIKFPKINYKGAALSTVIRKKSSTPPIKTEDGFDFSALNFPYANSFVEQCTKVDTAKKCEERNSVSKDSSNENSSPYTIPKYLIKHRSPLDIQNFTQDRFAVMNATLPKELVIEVNLPLLNSSETVILDVTEKSLSLICDKPAKYKLDLTLPYTIDEDAGNAKFDKSLRKLVLTLPLKFRRETTPPSDFGRECEDSGVESDLGRRTPELSSGDDDSIECANDDNKECANNNSKIEEIKSGPIASSGDCKVNRTLSVNKITTFLNPNRHYSLPPSSCDIKDSLIKLTFQVKNVDPNSINHIFLGDNSCGIHIRFSSIGTGYFPLHYAFCAKFPNEAKISGETLSIKALDNSVVVQFQLEACDTVLTEYYIGVNEAQLNKHDITEPTKQALRTSEVEPEKHTSVEHNAAKSDEDEANASSKDTQKSDAIAINSSQPKHRVLARTLSESSGDDLSPRKGILKRTSRSMSESSVDDFLCSCSFDMISEEDDGGSQKKSVRFSEVVSQKVYRTNSSILGQRRKNQRKIRNKKKAQETRRASESETSDWEQEREEKGKEDKTTDDDDDDEEDINGNQGDDSPQASPTEAKEDPESNETTRPLRGKITRKGNETAFAGLSEETKLNLVTDMMFDLDM